MSFSFGEVYGFVTGVVFFIILLGILIFVHELGHFVAAKWLNIYVVRFALGWGKRLFGVKWGETDYCVKAIPIGGYVKMVGQEDMPRSPEEAEEADPDLPDDVPPERRFDTQSPRNKLIVSFAGSFMNIVFAVPVLWLVFMVGIQTPIADQDVRIGAVIKGTPAEEAGLKPGQRVLSINGNPIDKWEELFLKALTSENEPLDLELEDLSGQVTRVTVTPRIVGDAKRASLGVEPLLAQLVTNVIPDMPAERGGLKEGDIILAYDGNTPDNKNILALVKNINESAGREMAITVLRDEKIIDVLVTPEEVSVIDRVGFQGNVVAFIEKEVEDKEGAELKPSEVSVSVQRLELGDTVVAINGEPVIDEEMGNFLAAGKYAQAKELILSVDRPRGMFQKQERLDITVPLTRKGRIGVLFSPFALEKSGPVDSFVKSLEAFGHLFKLTIITPYYLVTGKFSPRELAGPIGIAVMTEQHRRFGFSYYLNFMALITINLGIINLLPIPVLDGGMIMITLVEVVRRKPLDDKYLIFLQKIGLVFVGLLILVATYNDIRRVINYLFGGEFLE